MVSSVLFAGGEDLDFTYPNGGFSGAFSSSNSIGQFSYNTSGGQRGGYARQGIGFQVNSAIDTLHYLRANFAATTSFWATYRINAQTQSNAGSGTAGVRPLRFVDASGIERIRVNFVGAAAQPSDTFNVYKVDAAGTATQLGSTSTGRLGSFSAGNSVFASIPDKIDVFINYAVAGQITVYCNGTQTYTFSGDVTTNSVTALAGMDMGQHCYFAQNGAYAYTTFSEVIVATRDTRNMSLVTQAPTANGNTHNWDGGTAANAANNSALTAQASPQFSGTPGQTQEYTVTPAIPAGSYGVVSVVHKAQATIGSSGPTKFDFVVRTGAADFVSSDFVPNGAWATYTNTWDLNPNTGAAWLTTELVNASTLYNMGLKSVA